jgi:hypothetical protein
MDENTIDYPVPAYSSGREAQFMHRGKENRRAGTSINFESY